MEGNLEHTKIKMIKAFIITILNILHLGSDLMCLTKFQSATV